MKKLIQDAANNAFIVGLAILLSIINSVGGIIFFTLIVLEKCK